MHKLASPLPGGGGEGAAEVAASQCVLLLAGSAVHLKAFANSGIVARGELAMCQTQAGMRKHRFLGSG